MQLDIKDVISSEILKSVDEIEIMGKRQFETFVLQRLENGICTNFFNPVRKNKLPTFYSQHITITDIFENRKEGADEGRQDVFSAVHCSSSSKW